MERDLRSQGAVHGGIAFDRAIEQLYSKGQCLKKFQQLQPK